MIGDAIAADLKALVELVLLAVGAFPSESSLEHHPFDTPERLVDACIVAVEAVGLDIVGLPGVETMTEDSGHGSGREVAAGDIVHETWNNAVVALPVPWLPFQEQPCTSAVVAGLIVHSGGIVVAWYSLVLRAKMWK